VATVTGSPAVIASCSNGSLGCSEVAAVEGACGQCAVADQSSFLLVNLFATAVAARWSGCSGRGRSTWPV
jgi:hypothetical protein